MGDETPSETLTSILRSAAENHGGSPAIIVAEGGPSISHAQLQEAVDHAAAQIRRAGVKPGELVSLAFPNTLEFVVLFLGVTRARAVAAPLNAAYTQDEFNFFLDDAASKLLLVPAKGGNPAAEAAAGTLGIPVAAAATWLEGATGVTLQPHARLELAASDPGPGELPLGSDEALFLHTSGTTSRPKGVPLTQFNLWASIRTISAHYDLDSSDRCYCVMPLFHVHGLLAALLSQLAVGGATVLPAGGRFSANAFWADVRSQGATWYTAVPTMHQILLSRHRTQGTPPGEGYPSLRFIRSCSASLAPAVLAGLEEAFAAPVLEAYAMTEAAHQMCANPLPSNGPHKPGTVGLPTGIQLAILDGQGQKLPPGEIGEVCIQGPNVTAGYRNNPSANEQAYAFGWFHTGDQGKLDEDGYLTLTGRIKELINRGGEKISPVELDAALLAHDDVAEAVAFGAPDEKYGEEVNAAVVVNKGSSLTEADLQAFVGRQLAAFKVPKKIFFADSVPRTATGKIQRRFVAEHFLKPAPAPESDAAQAKAEGEASSPAADDGASTRVDGNTVAALALARAGVRHMFGVVGIPITAFATEAQKAGIRFIAFRNEQAAGYAAAAAGFLTGVPGALLTVSGPGCVHGLAGLSHASVNAWPLVLISGSSVQADKGKGDFQELDQMVAVKPFAKLTAQAKGVGEIPDSVRRVVWAAVEGRPGGVYLDLPADILHETLSRDEVQGLLANIPAFVPSWAPNGVAAQEADPSKVAEAFELLKSAKAPLLVLGKGAAFARAEGPLRELVEALNLPFVATPMGKGVLPDVHELSVGAARSLALKDADVVLVVGARLNWMLHFGEPPRWNPNVKFILVDIDEAEVALRKPAVGLVGDARAAITQLNKKLKEDPFRLEESSSPWLQRLKAKASANQERLAASLARDTVPLDFYCSLRVVRDAIAAVASSGGLPPVLATEGANTMDVGRQVFEQSEPRTRLDAATWGTMGVGLGYAIAAAVTQPGRLVIAVEGDSAFGFSGMEVETIVRYKLPIVVVVMNNGGVYGGDRRGPVVIPDEIKSDPPPTAFVPGARYDQIMEAFGGKGYLVNTPQQLAAALKESFENLKPALINVTVDPLAGVESGRMTHRN